MLESVEWGEYRLGDLFEIRPTKAYKYTNGDLFSFSGDTPVVTNTSLNNGISGTVGLDPTEAGGIITYSDTTTSDAIFYQPYPFVGYSHIQGLYPKNREWSKNALLYVVVSFRKSAYGLFDYGNKFNRAIASDMKIALPTREGEIDYEFMERFIAELNAARLAELNAYLTITGLKDYTLTPEEEQALQCFESNHIEWSEFKMEKLFRRRDTKKLSYKAKELPKEPKGEYSLPCLTSSFLNQGLNYYAPRKDASILKDVISIPSNSDVYRAYYQSRDFTVLSDAYAIEWKYGNIKISPKQYLFLVSSINQVTDLPIYSYKNKLGGWNVVKEKDISLPTLDDEIDYALMETLISAIQKLVIKDVVLYADREIEATKRVIDKTSKSKVVSQKVCKLQ